MNYGMEEYIRTIIQWKIKGEMMFPEDVLNMMIDNGLVNVDYIKNMYDEESKKEFYIKLPKQHI